MPGGYPPQSAAIRIGRGGRSGRSLPVPSPLRPAPLTLLAAACAAPASAPAAQQSFTTAGSHPWVVPIAVTTVQATIVGGNGGSGSAGSTNQAEGGLGATARVTLAVTPGETLYAQVAGNGHQDGTPGFGGGGFGGSVVVLLAGAPGGGGGGGASAIRACPAPCAPLVVAGGGGGGGGAGRDLTPTINGGNGGAGGMPGLDGEPDLTSDAGGGAGGAGTSGGPGAAGANSYENAAQAGSPAAGGDGGTAIGGGGGGGGGGLYGGGGGGGRRHAFADFNTLQFFRRRRRRRWRGRLGRPGGHRARGRLHLASTVQTSQPRVTLTWDAPLPTVATRAATVADARATLAGTVNPNLSP